MLLASYNLDSIPHVSHGFFTRKGGVSTGIFSSLNCGARSVDNAENVDRNRSLVAEKLGTSGDNLLSLCQVHSARVITVTEKWETDTRPEGDAMVTNVPGMALGILTADCVPVLLADEKNRVIGAAHSGWKGAFSGINRQTVDAMLRLGARRESIAAAIGPAIAQRSYEVEHAFYEKFVLQAQANSGYFIPSAVSGRWMFNLKAFVRDALRETGVAHINMLENDTYIEEDAFFSYRRATHRGEADYGRQISAIMLKP